MSKNSWYNKQFGSSSIFGNRNNVTSGNYGTNFWGKGVFSQYKGDNTVEKAKLLNAIKNFVRIQTGKNITVKYSTKNDQSFTDGRSITISKDVKDNFDVTVGLALHEASHIVKTDFNVLRAMMNNATPTAVLDKKYHNHKNLIKEMHNWVEDRWLDDWSYRTAPGYKNYYLELYKHYFQHELVNLAIEKGMTFDMSSGTLTPVGSLKEETIENYMFYLINLTNPNIKLNELKGLREIWDVLDLKNIKRQKDTKNNLDLTTEVFDIISKYVSKQNMKDNDDSNSKWNQHGDDGEDDGSEFDGDLEELLKNMKPGEGKGGKPIKLSKRNRELLKDLLKKQSDFLEGKVTKEKMEESEEKKVSALIESETEEHGVKTRRSDFEVVTVNKVTMDTVESSIYGVLSKYHNNRESVERGIQLGTMLGRKLQVRTEERVLISSRLQAGKVDKRMLHTIGSGNESIFFTKITDKYEDMAIHISLDLSGSMSGSKWEETLVSTIAIAKATSMIKGIRTQISLRYSDNIGSNKEQPIVINFYDSLHDSVSKLYWFEYVNPDGATPEGLCYEALMKKIIKPLLNKNTLFINFSDGAPGMSGLGGDDGIEVTRNAVNKMKQSGVKILSYFIGDAGWSCSDSFKQMYGNDATFIDVTDIVPLARSINKNFLMMGKSQG